MKLVEETKDVLDVLNTMQMESTAQDVRLYLVEITLKSMIDKPGCSSWEEYMIYFKYLGHEMLSLLSTDDYRSFPDFLVKKHDDYGAEPLFQSGIPGMMDRMIHKIARIKNLKKKPDTGDHIKAEILDILGYAVLGYKFAEYEITMELPEAASEADRTDSGGNLL